MSDLRTRARTAAAAEPDGWPTTAQPGQPTPPPAPAGPAASEALPDVDVPEGIDPDAADVPVHSAVVRVMRDLGKVGKGDKYNAPGTRFDFRGVDRVVNAVAPLLRKHGVLVVPELVDAQYRDVARKEGGGRNHECVVTMRYRWIGPRGDELVATVAGESLDTSDKGTAKAQAVAWRVCLIQMLAIPTGDPDPDSIHIERGEQPVPKPGDYRDEITDPRTSLGRLRQIRTELATHRLDSAVVTNEVGDEEALGALVQRIGRARQNGGA